jgi:hypothetical protein
MGLKVDRQLLAFSSFLLAGVLSAHAANEEIEN